MSLIRELFFESWKDHEPKDAERKAVQCPPDGVLAKRDIVYLQQDDHTELMDIFFTEKAKGMLPVIVDVHGGGWVYGNKELNEYFCMELAKLGFVVCDINYRLCPVTDLKGQVQDVTAALQWIFDHIHQYVGDSEQRSVTGDSAGAQLAFLVCAASANEAYRRSYEITSLSKPIKALGLTCPVSCLHEMAKSQDEMTREWMQVLYGGEPEQSSLWNCSDYADILTDCKELPSIYILTTKGDQKYYRQSLALHDLMNRKQIEHVYREWESMENKDLGHVFNVLYPACQDSRAANQEMVYFFLNVRR